MNAFILQVGPNRSLKTIVSAARKAAAGAVIEVDAGDYVSDVAVWKQDDITLRTVGGRVRLLAQGAAAVHDLDNVRLGPEAWIASLHLQ